MSLSLSFRSAWIHAAGALAALTLTVVYPGASFAALSVPVGVEQLSPAESDVLHRLNDARQAAGIPPVTAASTIDAIARGRSDDMASRNYFAHEIPGCSALLDRCNVLGILDSRHISYHWAGEILEWNLFLTRFDQEQADAMAVEDFMRSPLHRAILLDPRYTEAGVGVGLGPDKKMLLTVVFLQT